MNPVAAHGRIWHQTSSGGDFAECWRLDLDLDLRMQTWKHGLSRL